MDFNALFDNAMDETIDTLKDVSCYRDDIETLLKDNDERYLYAALLAFSRVLLESYHERLRAKLMTYDINIDNM